MVAKNTIDRRSGAMSPKDCATTIVNGNLTPTGGGTGNFAFEVKSAVAGSQHAVWGAVFSNTSTTVPAILIFTSGPSDPMSHYITVPPMSTVSLFPQDDVGPLCIAETSKFVRCTNIGSTTYAGYGAPVEATFYVKTYRNYDL